MQGDLLETKLHAPVTKRLQVPRPRLMAMLEKATASRLTLVSAPPGFGKSTLLADWLGAPGRAFSAAWLSLDAGDNDPATFWSYVAGALHNASSAVGAEARRSLDDAPTDAVLRTLINDLHELGNDIALVLDDYHVVDAQEVHDAVEFLVDHLPSNAHLVIATRADPPLSLARLRARGELVEIRAADLRFTPDETASYLRDVMGLPLGADGVAALEERTEGWIAALQLAALSMQGRDDLEAFISRFAGDDRYVVDYLVEEVLRRQPEAVRSFLLRTSILTRMNASLVNAVTGGDDGKATLELLDRANLFVIPLDDRRDWFRYHHLFAEVLQAHLRDEQPDVDLALHARASDWYEQHGERAEAISHALSAGSFDRAADLVELALPDLRRMRQEATIRRFLEALPEDLIRARPLLAVGLVGARMSTGTFDGVDALLRSAERWLDMPEGEPERANSRPTGMVVRDEEEFRRLPGAIAIYRAAIARELGDVVGTMEHARRALDLAGEADDFGRGAAAALLGLAHWTVGDLNGAYRWYAEGMASLERAGYIADVVGGSVTRAGIRLAQGRLTEALSAYERGLALATEPGRPVLRGAADMHTGISEILRERADLEGARRHLEAGRQLGDENDMPQNAHRSRVAMARILEAEGDLDGALELLAEAERLYQSDFAPNLRPIAAIRAKLWIAQGQLSRAWGWARERGLGVTDDLSYLREYEHMILARLLVADSESGAADPSVRAALGLLGRLLDAAERGDRWRSVIELLALQALAHERAGDRPRALASLDRAIEFAEPEGYIRVFVDEGLPMARLLKQLAKEAEDAAYLRRLVASFGGPSRRNEQGLLEPLSERELDVLRLLATELGGPDIARELFVSLNTMRTHTRNIYAKLGVSSRRAAVRRAAELNLVAGVADR